MSYGHCVEVKLCHTCCRVCVQTMSPTSGLHGEEKKCVVSKALLEFRWCLLCESDSILEIVYRVPGAALCYFCLRPPARPSLYKI